MTGHLRNRVLAVVLALLLSSCIDGHEEYWINSSGGGRAKLVYQLPAMAAELGGGEEGIRQKVAAFLKNNEAFTGSSYEVMTHEGRIQVTVEVQFRSVRDLQKLQSGDAGGPSAPPPAAARHFSGETQLKISGLTLDFTRRISPGKAMPGALFLPKRELNGHALTYVFHLPMEALESNATRMEDGGRTLIWEVPLATALREPVVTHFKARIPLPRWLWPVVIVIGLIVWCAIVRWRKRRRRTS